MFGSLSFFVNAENIPHRIRDLAERRLSFHGSDDGRNQVGAIASRLSDAGQHRRPGRSATLGAKRPDALNLATFTLGIDTENDRLSSFR